MILKRIKRTTYIPKRKQYCELYSVKIKELGYFDPIDQIAEDLKLPLGEAKSVVSTIMGRYEAALLKGYKIKLGDIVELKVVLNSHAYEEKNKWKADRNSISGTKMRLRVCKLFNIKLRYEISDAEFEL